MSKMENREKTTEQLQEDLRKTREELAIQKWGLEKTLGGMKVLVTELAQKEKEVREASAKDEAILASIGDGLVAVDKEGKILMANKAFENLVGWKAKEVLGKLLVEVVPREDEAGNIVPFNERILNKVLSTTTTTTTTTTDWYYLRKDKTRFPVASIITPFILEGKIIGAVEVFRDITKEKEIDRAKSEFVSLASHQLKTPPTAIKWLTEILLDNKMSKLTEKQKGYLNDVHSKNEQMIKLVNALLDVSRIELGTFAIKPSLVDVNLLVRGIIDDLKLRVNEKDLHLKAEYAKQKLVINTDANLLQMVIQNLLTNAVNYTPEKGNITIEVLSKNKGENFGERAILEDSVAFKVADNGCGIPKQQQDKIFTKLFRADNAREKYTDGTGLGLYIVKSILDHFGGAIWFTSEENKGTVFYIIIPLAGTKARVGEKQLTSASIFN